MTKVLIVDDEVEVRQFLSRSLAGCGYDISEACDGSQALECLAQERPDVVITDLLMPVMDGFELALRIRANPDHAATEVIFFTGRASPRQVQAMAETAGVTQVVTKPATIDEVQGAVDAALHRKHPVKTDLSSGLDAEHQMALVEGAAPVNSVSPHREFEDGRFRNYFERALEPIILFTGDGTCVDANPAAAKILGYEQQSLIKSNLWNLIPAGHSFSTREVWNRLLSEGSCEGELSLLHRNGSKLELEFSGVADIEPGVHLSIWRPSSRNKFLARI